MHSSMLLLGTLQITSKLFMMLSDIFLSTHQKLALLNLPHVPSIGFKLITKNNINNNNNYIYNKNDKIFTINKYY